MKRLLLTLAFALALLMNLSVRADDLVISNNAIICIFPDSWGYGGDPAVQQISGWRFPDYIWSYFVLNQPTNNLSFWNFGRSGGTMDNVLTNALQLAGLPAWGYASNNFQHLGIAVTTDNGSLNNLQMVNSLSNIMHAPPLMSDGDATLHTQTGWAATHIVGWIGLGEPPHVGIGPDLEQGDRSYAATNAGALFGIRGIDGFTPLTNSWFNDSAVHAGSNVQWFVGELTNHFASGGALSWAFAFLKSITTDTNISTCAIDWNTLAPTTNHCFASSISRNGNTLTFNRIDDRLPFGFDVPGTVLAEGVTTNDARGAFILNPSDANYFQFTLKIANLPNGYYRIDVDGETIAAQISSDELSSPNGWNMFTNYVGPYWRQRASEVAEERRVDYVDPVTLVPGSAGDAKGQISYISFASAHWQGQESGETPGAGLRGDALIASMHTNVSFLTTNSTFSFAAVKAAAQPTTHTFRITRISGLRVRVRGAH